MGVMQMTTGNARSFGFQRWRRGALWRAIALGTCLLIPAATAQEALLPKHVTPAAQDAVKRGLDFLVKTQAPDGSWSNNSDGREYPVSMTALAGMAFLAHGHTTTRGEYADTVRKAVRYIMSNARPDGLISSANEYGGRSMYGHGFSLLFLSCAYGMETDERTRRRMHEIIDKAVIMTGKAQSPLGGWTYTPNSGDEGSVTITQMQALRAAHNAGFTVPEATVNKGVKYLENCKTPEGGIRYSFHSGNQTRLPISAAAIACLYSAGEYDSPLAEACLEYTFKQFQAQRDRFSKGGGHDYYAHLYAAQAFYQAGDEYWDAYFPSAQKQFIDQQNQQDGSWSGDGIGPTYGTAIACIVLQLPYKFLPIYQR